MDSEAEGTKPHLEDEERYSQLEPLTKKAKKKKQKNKQLPPVEAKVEVLHDHHQRIPPIVGYFPSGFDPQRNIDGETKAGPDSTTVQVYRHRKMPKRLQLVVSPSGSPVDFVGTSYSGEAATGQGCMYALGVFDKEKQTLRVVPIAANKIFRLEPRVKGMDQSEKESETVEMGELTPQQRQEKLTAEFGTKKSMNRDRKALALKKHDENPDFQESLDGKLKKVVVNKEALENTEAHIALNIPPYDASATTPEEAYLLDKIILKVEWPFLEDIYNLLQQKGEPNFSAYPIFVRNRIEKLRNIQDETEKKRLACMFSFINHLIKFKEQHSVDYSSVKDHKIPSILRHRFTTMFPATEFRKLPPEKIILLIRYVLVLTLFVDEFQTDFADIATDLRMDSASLRIHYQGLGCKLSRLNRVLYATLPVPLQFPELRQRKQKRKK